MTIEDAFSRAAKVSPQYQAMQLFVRVEEERFGRPLPHTFDWSETTRGTIRWRDVDEFSRTRGGEVGDGVVMLVAPSGPVPDLILTDTGEWLVVKSGAGQDSLKVATKFIVRRWKEDCLPTIRKQAP